MNPSINDIISQLINYSIRNLVTLLDWITSPTILGVAIFLSFNAFHAIAIRQKELADKVKTWRYNARVFYTLGSLLLLSGTIRNIVKNQNDWQLSLIFSVITTALVIFCLFTVIRRRERREEESQAKTK
jgi:Na+/melibiose symporter-like transporter